MLEVSLEMHWDVDPNSSVGGLASESGGGGADEIPVLDCVEDDEDFVGDLGLRGPVPGRPELKGVNVFLVKEETRGKVVPD